MHEPTCNTCANPAYRPFHRVDEHGKTIMGCVDEFHKDHVMPCTAMKAQQTFEQQLVEALLHADKWLSIVKEKGDLPPYEWGFLPIHQALANALGEYKGVYRDDKTTSG